MNKYLYLLVDTLRKKGVLESITYGLVKSSEKFFSIIKIIFLNLRGYTIDPSVVLKGDNFFFQSTKHAVSISKNTVIGKHTRISCGGNGQIFIGENVLIDDYVYIMAHEHVVIKKNTKIAAFSFITDFNHKFNDKKIPLVKQGYETKAVEIGENVWVGTHVIVLPGVKIGDGAVVGAGSVVTKNIASNSVIGGNPAKMIRQIL